MMQICLHINDVLLTQNDVGFANDVFSMKMIL